MKINPLLFILSHGNQQAALYRGFVDLQLCTASSSLASRRSYSFFAALLSLIMHNVQRRVRNGFSIR